KGELKARSSHGERYTDIFYVQLDSTRILRTCQASDQLLLSDDEGKTWKVVKAPDHAISIFNIRDSIAVMFTYDQMYISSDRGATWKREKKGLPKPQDEMYGVISTGVVTEDGTIMALVSAQEDEVYQHLAYFYDLKKGKWEKDQTGRVYEWSSDEFFPAGGNAILLRNGETDKYSISYDKGKTWGVLNPNDPVGHPQDLFIQDNRIYIVAGNLYFFQFPPACTERNPEPPVVKGPHVSLNDSLKGKLLLFPVKMALASDQVSVYQQCAGKDGGCSKFIMHVPNDTVITVINILHLEGDVQVIEETYDVYATLQAGNYELWLYNISLTGCYFLQCRFKNETAGQRIGTSCYFY
ncbi:MAG TPA: sialidase family protein, partial [Bacteroidia bacterium]|nr:sialidase family protein [Bacteroidia bacterium]